MSENFNYETIDEALINADGITEAAEAHGTLCGMVCISGKGDLENWLSHVLGEHDPRDLNIKDEISILKKIHDKTVLDLTEQNYELELLTHGDDTPLDIRVDDLCHWCQGFLYGLSLSGLTDITKLPQDASEILQDMMDISRAGYNPEEDEDENESAFAEIVEYIRVGTYVIFNTFNGDGFSVNTNTIHSWIARHKK